MTVLHYIHHAAFSLNDGKTTLLFDPYLENNPEGLSSGDLKADYIFISHFHGDHVGEAYAIAKRTEALIITTMVKRSYLFATRHTAGPTT